jgi:L-alanine-DL-glutamate epimerase-like enolase superfamily enzyme
LRNGFREILEEGALNIIAPDFQKVGGLLEAKRICEMADTYYIGASPHNISSPIGLVAAAHVCAAVPNFICLEYHAADVPFWNDLALGFDGDVIQQSFPIFSIR